MEDMTPGQKRLHDMLVQIGWKLRPCGCGYYAVMNHTGERTRWLAAHQELQSDCKELFGKKASKYGCSGVVFVKYDEVDMRLSEYGDALFISPTGEPKGNGPHISFYNHSDALKRKRLKKQ